MKNAKQVLALILTITLLFVALPGLSAFAANSGFTPPDPPGADFDDNNDFVPGEVLAPAESLQHAQEIAMAYGLELKSYAYGIAVLAAADPEAEVEQSASMAMGAEVQISGIPGLSLNRVYQLYEVAYKYDAPVYTYMSDTMRNTRYTTSYVSEKYGKIRTLEPLRELRSVSVQASFSQWHHEVMDSGRAWKISTGEDVVVAVIDTGIDINHPDFAGRISAKSYNSYTDQVGIDYVRDDYGHGTHVSGIVAGELNEQVGVCGVAPDVELLVIKADSIIDPILGALFESADLYRAINYATENGAKIINMSLGRHYDEGADELEQAIIAKAVANGVTVVCAAGNDSNSHAGYPAAYPETIAVSAVKEGPLFDYGYSNYGPEIDVAAPGTDIYSTFMGGGYIYDSGTSMASPCVAGAAALILSLHPEYTPQQVRDILCQTAQDAGELGRDDYYGYGIVNSYAAILGPEALHTVTYDYNDGNRVPVTLKIIPGSALFKLPIPRWAGYAFNGWYDCETDEEFRFAGAVEEDINLYAQWVEAEDGMYVLEFPDVNFRREVLRLLNEKDDGHRKESNIVDAEDLEALAAVEALDVGYRDIRDLTGLKYFSGLVYFSCFANQVTELNLSENSALETLYCDYNGLTKLDISNNSALKFLGSIGNKLTELDVSNCISLKYINCDYNYLTELDVSNCPLLLEFWCTDNQLTTLDVSNNTALESLDCSGNELSALDVSNNTSLEQLYCDNNQVDELDMSKNIELKTLACSNNQLTELDLANNTKLSGYCLGSSSESFPDGHVLTVDTSGGLSCSNNQLKTLNLPKSTELGVVICNNNQLAALDVSSNTALEVLLCDTNRLTTLDVSKNINLQSLWCYENQLSSLDVSKNTVLDQFSCTANYIKSIDDVIGWQEIGLVLNKTFFFHLQYAGVPPTGKNITAYFKDPGFLAVVRDIIGKSEGPILDYDVAQITVLNVASWNTEYSISDLSGIGHFGSLTNLYCSGQQLKELDVSNNLVLRTLECDDNKLSSLDVSNNTVLRYLYCGDNQLTALDVSNNIALKELNCGGNQLTALNVTNNTDLEELGCWSNQLVALNVSQNIALRYLYCNSNQLSILDISKNTALAYLWCYDNQLTKLDVSNNDLLWHLDCSNNYMKSPDDVLGWQEIGLVLDETFLFHPQRAGMEPLTYAEEFPDANFRQVVLELLHEGGVDRTEESFVEEEDIEILAAVTALAIEYMNIGDLTGLQYFSGLKELECYGNQITTLDLSANTALVILSCRGNQLNTLNVSNNIALEYLDCDYNKLITLDVSNNPLIEILGCNDNLLTTLDLSNNTALAYLTCADNQLRKLDVSQNTSLMTLGCTGNLLSSLDVSKNTRLYWLNCRNNYIKSTADVRGWQKLGLVPEKTFLFDPQRTDIEPLACTGIVTKVDSIMMWNTDAAKFCRQYQAVTIYNGEGEEVPYIFTEEFRNAYNAYLDGFAVEEVTYLWDKATTASDWDAVAGTAAGQPNKGEAIPAGGFTEGSIVELMLDEHHHVQGIGNYAAYTNSTELNAQIRVNSSRNRVIIDNSVYLLNESTLIFNVSRDADCEYAGVSIQSVTEALSEDINAAKVVAFELDSGFNLVVLYIVGSDIGRVRFGVVTRYGTNSNGDYFVINDSSIYLSDDSARVDVTPAVIAYTVSNSRATLAAIDPTQRGIIATKAGAYADLDTVQADMNALLGDGWYAVTGAVTRLRFPNMSLTIGGESVLVTGDTFLYDLVADDYIDLYTVGPDFFGKDAIAVCDSNGEALFIAVFGSAHSNLSPPRDFLGLKFPAMIDFS